MQVILLGTVALNEIELAMKLVIKQNTVVQCFNLFLQAFFLVPKVPLCLKNSASTTTTLWVTACSIVWLDTPTPNLVLATARAL